MGSMANSGRWKQNIHIHHATPQTRRQRLRVPAENVHDHRPGHTGENGVSIIRDLRAGIGCDEGGERVHVGLDGELGKSKHHTRKDINNDLDSS